MLYEDLVYGKQKIDDPLALALINAPSLQRLRGVDQAGYLHPFRPGWKTHNRFDHSVGVYLLLRQFGAPHDEQIAGLIHDVSHTAFSHCVDYAIGDEESQKTQSGQDDAFESFVRTSEIPDILQQFGVDVNSVLDDSRFPLKEQSLPDLCADRIDYSLRSAVLANKAGSNEVVFFLNSLVTDRGRWVFRTRDAAEQYAEMFSDLNNSDYASLTSAGMYCCVGACLRHAIQHRYITAKDLYATDQEVLEKLQAHLDEDSEFLRLYERMHNKEQITHNPHDFEEKVFCKSRMVDPLFYWEGGVARISDLDSNWKRRIEQESVPRSYCLHFSRRVPLESERR